MARIQTPQHVQELQAEFKIREQFGLELLETVQPTYELGVQKVASTGYPRKCMGTIIGAAGGVGTNIECALRCPANRGIVILLTKVVAISLAGVDATMRIDDTVAMASVNATFLTKGFQDGRLAALVPEGVLETANPLTAAPNGAFVGAIVGVVDALVPYPLDFILGGDSYFLVRSDGANAALRVNFEWTEFLLEDR